MTSSSRRDFIRGLSAMLGGVAASSVLAGNALAVAQAYAPGSGEIIKAGKVFSVKELTLLAAICQIVLPKTDTPGAADVDTHGFIDNQLFHCYSKMQQQKMKALLALIDHSAKRRHHNGFLELLPDAQHVLLSELDCGEAEFTTTQRQDFKSLKQLICFGYYTSEVGASQELRYQAIPGGFKGSVAYKTKDKAWGSLGLRY